MESEEKKNGEPDLKEAQRLLLEDVQNRVRKCSEDVNGVLRKYGMRIEATMLVAESGITPLISFLPEVQNETNTQ